ncbi:hypothetical protein [Ferrimonas sp. SCSIO 43195]|uniref:hypothetical protein n=1 Tax=Ferrimonas sp. SCSIO 43195 TaxID=2822844 RepID=UPI002075265A|nr:hypothetical protein [Ferrimonas sp. SCSIO 43195]USD38033.1 hypothetical protein J8Z22_02375 [Ferrimonas sp. SCSIO 43195]
MKTALIWGALLLAGCSNLNTTFNRPYAQPESVAVSAAEPPPEPLSQTRAEAGEVQVVAVLGMTPQRQMRLQLASSATEQWVTLTDVDLPGLSDRCPLERNLARGLSYWLQQQLDQGARLVLSQQRRSGDRSVLAQAHLDGHPLGPLLLAEGLAQPFGSGRWCPESAP